MDILRAGEASSSSFAPGHRYQGFLSFRGKETRTNFTNHLYKALVQAQIVTFRDKEEIKRGQNIPFEIDKAIGESKIAAIVLSKRYASSKSCLNELVRILEIKKTRGLTVIPIFYYVQPSEVQHQRGSFGKAFKRKFESKEEMNKMEEWRGALRAVAELKGREVDGYESNFIQEIVEDIKGELNPTPWPFLSRNPIQQIKRMVTWMASSIFGYSGGFDFLTGRGHRSICSALHVLFPSFCTSKSFSKPTMSNHFSTLRDIEEGREDRTTFELLEESTYKIPLPQFQFLPFEHIESCLDNDTQLIDVIGQLTGMTDAEDHAVRRSAGKKRVIHIQDSRGKTIRVTLWGDQANQITVELCQQNTKPLIVVVTSISVGMFRGKIWLSTSRLSKVYLNPNIPEVENLKKSVLSIYQQLTYIQTTSKSIEEILNLRAESKSMEMMVKCRGTINRINKEVWYYFSCTKCNKKVPKKESTFWCEHCKSEERHPTPRYKLHVEVKDDSASTTFVIFDKLAENIIQLPISQLSNDKDLFDGNADFPAVIDQLVGKTYVFQLKLNHFNIVIGLENYRVNAMQEEDITPHSASITLSGIKPQSHPQSISPQRTKRKNENEGENKFDKTQSKKIKTVRDDERE